MTCWWTQAAKRGAGAGGFRTSVARSRAAQLNVNVVRSHSVLRRPPEARGVEIGRTCLTDTSIGIPVQDRRGICIVPSLATPFCVVASSSSSLFLAPGLLMLVEAVCIV